MRILIADDDPTSREIAARLIASAGYEVHAVADGDAALDALLGAPFDVALLDLQMPGLDGDVVARAVRDALPAARCPRLIALTAAADPGAVRRIVSLGFDACVPKPLRLTALHAALSATVPSDSPLPVPPPADPYPARSPAADPALASAIRAAAHDQAQLRALATRLLASPVVAESPLVAGLCGRLLSALATGKSDVAELTEALAIQFDEDG
ncbi:MAG: hypothetical protein OHK0015_22930 [Chloroflexi bacterium OHK40]